MQQFINLEQYNISHPKHILYCELQNYYIAIQHEQQHLSLNFFEVQNTADDSTPFPVQVKCQFDLSEFLRQTDENIFKLLFLDNKSAATIVKPILINNQVLVLALTYSSKKSVIIQINIQSFEQITVINIQERTDGVLKLLHLENGQSQHFYIVTENNVYLVHEVVSQSETLLYNPLDKKQKNLKICDAHIGDRFLVIILGNGDVILHDKQQLNKLHRICHSDAKIISSGLFQTVDVVQKRDVLLNEQGGANVSKQNIIVIQEESNMGNKIYHKTRILKLKPQIINSDQQFDSWFKIIEVQTDNYVDVYGIKKILDYQKLTASLSYVLVQTEKNGIFCIDFKEEGTILKPSLKSVNLSSQDKQDLQFQTEQNQNNANQTQILYIELLNTQISDRSMSYNDQLMSVQPANISQAQQENLLRLHYFLKCSCQFQQGYGKSDNTRKITQLQFFFISDTQLGIMDTQSADKTFIDEVYANSNSVEELNKWVNACMQVLQETELIYDKNKILAEINVTNQQSANIVQQIFECTNNQKIADVFIFRMLSDVTLFKQLQYILQLYEQKVFIQNRNHIIYNVRFITYLATFIIDQAIYLLLEGWNMLNGMLQDQTFQYNYNINELQMYADIYKLLKNPVQNSIIVLGQLYNMLNQDNEYLGRSKYATVKGEIFLGLSVIFSNMIDFKDNNKYCSIFGQFSKPQQNYQNFILSKQFGNFKNDELKEEYNMQESVQDYQQLVDRTQISAIKILQELAMNILNCQIKSLQDYFQEMISYIEAIERDQNNYHTISYNQVNDNTYYEMVQHNYKQLLEIMKVMYAYQLYQLQSSENQENQKQLQIQIEKNIEELSSISDEKNCMDVAFLSKLMFECDRQRSQQEDDLNNNFHHNIDLQQFKQRKSKQLFEFIQLVGQNIISSIKSEQINKQLTHQDLLRVKQQIDKTFSQIFDCSRISQAPKQSLYGQYNQQQQFQNHAVEYDQYTYKHFIVKLCHMCAQQLKFDIALGLAQFCFEDGQCSDDSIKMIQLLQNNFNSIQNIYHPCNSVFENTIRLLILRYQYTRDINNIQKAVQYMNLYFKDVAVDYKINSRMGILWCQIITQQISFTQYFFNNEINNTQVGVNSTQVNYNNIVGQRDDTQQWYQSQTRARMMEDINRQSLQLSQQQKQVQFNYNDLMQQLFLHNSLDELFKWTLVGYCFQNEKYFAFLLVLLFKYDRFLCLKMLKYCETNFNQLQRLNPSLELAITKLRQNFLKLPQWQREMDHDLSDMDRCVPNLYKASFYQQNFMFNSLAYSLSVIQNDDKDKIVKRINENNPQPLYLFKDAMLNMNQQLNNKLPSQYHQVNVNWNRNLAPYSVNYSNVNVQNSVYGQNAVPTYLRNYTAQNQQFNNQFNQYQQVVTTAQNPFKKTPTSQQQPTYRPTTGYQVRTTKALELRMKLQEDKRKAQMKDNFKPAQDNTYMPHKVNPYAQNKPTQLDFNNYIPEQQQQQYGNTVNQGQYNQNIYGYQNQQNTLQNNYNRQPYQNNIYNNNQYTQQQYGQAQPRKAEAFNVTWNNNVNQKQQFNNYGINQPAMPSGKEPQVQMIQNYQSVVHQQPRTTYNPYMNHPNNQEEQPIRTKYTQNIDIYNQQQPGEQPGQDVQTSNVVIKQIKKPNILKQDNMKVSPPPQQKPPVTFTL